MSLLLDALRQAEKNKVQATGSPTTGALLSVEQGIEGQPASPLSLIPQEASANTTGEWVEIALIPPPDFLTDVISPAPEIPIASFYGPGQQNSQPDIAGQANDVSPNHPQPDAAVIEGANINVLASKVESGSPAPLGQASPEQANRYLAESVLLAAQKPGTSKKHLILSGTLVGLMAAAGYLYWLTLPVTPRYTASTPATPPASPEPSAPVAAKASVDNAVVMETVVQTGDNSAQKQEDPVIDTHTVASAPAMATPDGSNPQLKPTVTDVVSIPKAPKISHTDTENFIVESPDPIIIKVQQQPPHAETYLNQAYQHYQKQDYVGAAGYYLQVLSDAPNNIDALLGMGVVAEQLGDKVTAESYYKKVQSLDNGNVYASSALIRLEQSQFPAERESNYQGLLEKFPDAAQTHAALGDLYAGQERWSEAQQAYFNATAKAPDNAEYHYNLAVSLDHLGKGAIARRYYQQALQLAKGSQVSFDSASVYLRLQQLPEQ